MKVILLFDGDKLENRYREYELSNSFAKDLCEGKKVSITFCHPFHGEIMVAKSVGSC